MTYIIFQVIDTPFKSGVCIPIDKLQYAESSNVDYLNENLEGHSKPLVSKKDGYQVEIAKWRFCDFVAAAQKFFPASERLFPNASELREQILKVLYFEMEISLSCLLNWMIFMAYDG